MAGISPLGNDWPTILRHLRSYRNAVTRIPEWAQYDGLNTQLAAPAADFCLSERFTSKATRTMGRVALMATRATELALADAGLLNDPLLKSGSIGIAFGSSAGTPKVICDFVKVLDRKSTRGINATTYIKMMSHTAPVNVATLSARAVSRNMVDHFSRH
jgi:3-oxoacyl-[acyl-carrier-protein] synthase II